MGTDEKGRIRRWKISQYNINPVFHQTFTFMFASCAFIIVSIFNVYVYSTAKESQTVQ